MNTQNSCKKDILSDNSLVDVLYSFQKYLIAQNMSHNTVLSYLCGVKIFFSHHSELTPDNLMLYKAELMEHYQPQTVNSRIRSLNAFLRFQHTDDTMHLRCLRLQQKTYLDYVISQGDYEYLIRRLWEDENYTFYFIVRFITTTGVRVSELVSLETEDVFNGHRDICSKGNKVRRIFFPSALRQKTLGWLNKEGRHRGPLFLSHLGTRMTISGVRSQLKVFASRYQLDPHVVYPHSFRHRFAKNFIENGGDIAFLSNLLGHDSIETTRIYLRRSSTEQARILDRVVDW